MAKNIKVTSVSGTENKYKIILSVNGVIQNHTLITAAELRTSAGKTLADSEVDATDWDFTNAGYILVKFGLAGLPSGTTTCYLITKDAQHTVGLAWETVLTITSVPLN